MVVSDDTSAWFIRVALDRRKENARIERTNPGYDKPVTAGFYGDPVRGVV